MWAWYWIVVVAIVVEIVCRWLYTRLFLLFKCRPISLSESSFSGFYRDVVLSGACLVGEKLSRDTVAKAVEGLSQLQCLSVHLNSFCVYSSSSKMTPAVRVVEISSPLDDRAVMDVLSQEVNCEFSSSSCPARAVLLLSSHSSSSSSCAVVLSCKHALFDGLSAIELLRRFLLLLGQQKETPVFFNDAQNARVVSSDDFLIVPNVLCIGVVQILFALLEVMRETRVFSIGSYARLKKKTKETTTKKEDDDESNAKTMLGMCRMSKSFSRRLLESCRQNDVTVGMAVSAACMKARGTLDESNSHVWSSLQADFRRLWKLPKEPFAFGNLTPVFSFTRSCQELNAQPSAKLAKSFMQDLRQGWGILRLSAAYYTYYGLLARYGISFLQHLTSLLRMRRQNTPIAVPLLTISNMGVLAADESDTLRTQNVALMSVDDLRHMPPLVHFYGAVTEAVRFGHFTVGSSSFRGELSLSVSFSTCSVTAEDAKQLLRRMCEILSADFGIPLDDQSLSVVVLSEK